MAFCLRKQIRLGISQNQLLRFLLFQHLKIDANMDSIVKRGYLFYGLKLHQMQVWETMSRRDHQSKNIQPWKIDMQEQISKMLGFSKP